MLQIDNCSRKRAYATAWEAQEVAEHQMSMNPGLVLRVYRCPNCGSYHLTSKPARF